MACDLFLVNINVDMINTLLKKNRCPREKKVKQLGQYLRLSLLEILNVWSQVDVYFTPHRKFKMESHNESLSYHDDSLTKSC